MAKFNELRSKAYIVFADSALVSQLKARFHSVTDQ